MNIAQAEPRSIEPDRKKTLVVYTAIVGAVGDVLQEVKAPPDKNQRPVQYVCFSDRRQAADSWLVRPPVWTHPISPRRTARWHKCMSHHLFPEAAATLWIDGSLQILVNPWELADTFLQSAPLAVFRHAERNCLYQEHLACLKCAKDDPLAMERQISAYRAEEYPENNGLFETGAVLRSQNPVISELNEMWWGQIEKGSLRDQLSINYVVWKMGLPAMTLDGSVYKNSYFRFRQH